MQIRALWRRVAVTIVVAIHVGLVGYGAKIHSPTIDEVAHLPAGIWNWTFGQFDLYKVNPPLVRMVAAAPVMAAGAKTNWQGYGDAPGQRPEFSIGATFIRENSPRVFLLFTYARWACFPFSLLGAWVVYCWSRELFGDLSALAALVMWCFSPNILAHAQMITPDVGATSFGVLCCWRLWHWTARPTWRNTLWFGLSLAGAELTKATWIVLLPLSLVLWGIRRWKARPEAAVETDAKLETQTPPISFKSQCVRYLAALLLAYQVFCLAYAYDGMFRPLGDYEFVSARLKPADSGRTGNVFRGTFLESVPVPLPSCYVEGIDVQKQEFEQDDRPSYLSGEFRYPGWWYYYLYALAIKVPLGAWLLGVLCVGALVLRRGHKISWRAHIFVLLPAVLILTFVSSQTGINRHLRYVLPIFPFVMIWLSQAFAMAKTRKLFTAIAALALGWGVVSSLLIYPHSLSYFNELVGGPKNGHRHLINSNIDWGQDLLLLRDWVDAHPEARPLSISFNNAYYPTEAGLQYRPPAPGPGSENLALEQAEYQAAGKTLPLGPQPGWYFISVNFLYVKYPRLRGVAYDLSYFQEFEPVDRIGYSILVYHITPDQAAAVRERIWQGKEAEQ